MKSQHEKSVPHPEKTKKAIKEAVREFRETEFNWLQNESEMRDERLKKTSKRSNQHLKISTRSMTKSPSDRMFNSVVATGAGQPKRSK